MDLVAEFMPKVRLLSLVGRVNCSVFSFKHRGIEFHHGLMPYTNIDFKKKKFRRKGFGSNYVTRIIIINLFLGQLNLSKQNNHAPQHQPISPPPPLPGFFICYSIS